MARLGVVRTTLLFSFQLSEHCSLISYSTTASPFSPAFVISPVAWQFSIYHVTCSYPSARAAKVVGSQIQYTSQLLFDFRSYHRTNFPVSVSKKLFQNILLGRLLYFFEKKLISVSCLLHIQSVSVNAQSKIKQSE